MRLPKKYLDERAEYVERLRETIAGCIRFIFAEREKWMRQYGFTTGTGVSVYFRKLHSYLEAEVELFHLMKTERLCSACKGRCCCLGHNGGYLYQHDILRISFALLGRNLRAIEADLRFPSHPGVIHNIVAEAFPTPTRKGKNIRPTVSFSGKNVYSPRNGCYFLTKAGCILEGAMKSHTCIGYQCEKIYGARDYPGKLFSYLTAFKPCISDVHEEYDSFVKAVKKAVPALDKFY